MTPLFFNCLYEKDTTSRVYIFVRDLGVHLFANA